MTGASITVAGMGITGLSRQNQQSRESIVRLTTSVDNLVRRFDALHVDIKSKDAEVFNRLSELERSVARLEERQNRA
jgi:hypothetical protein